MNRPSTDDLRFAVEWLRSYEAAPDEDASGVARVADWLEKQADKRDEEDAAAALIVKECAANGQKVSKKAALTWWRRNKRKTEKESR